jgi:hypothetical protein
MRKKPLIILKILKKSNNNSNNNNRYKLFNRANKRYKKINNNKHIWVTHKNNNINKNQLKIIKI